MSIFSYNKHWKVKSSVNSLSKNFKSRKRKGISGKISHAGWYEATSLSSSYPSLMGRLVQ